MSLSINPTLLRPIIRNNPILPRPNPLSLALPLRWPQPIHLPQSPLRLINMILPLKPAVRNMRLQDSINPGRGTPISVIIVRHMHRDVGDHDADEGCVGGGFGLSSDEEGFWWGGDEVYHDVEGG